jgi:hypothetical protein
MEMDSKGTHVILLLHYILYIIRDARIHVSP